MNASGVPQDAAITDLRDILLRAALYFFSRDLGDFAGLSRDEILQRADGVAPEQPAMQGELRGIIRDVIERDLMEKQRRVLLLMVFNEVPMDEVVRHLGANRDAVYKLLHDARRKVKSSLQARGFDVGETLALFGAPG